MGTRLQGQCEVGHPEIDPSILLAPQSLPAACPESVRRTLDSFHEPASLVKAAYSVVPHCGGNVSLAESKLCAGNCQSDKLSERCCGLVAALCSGEYRYPASSSYPSL